MPRIVKIKDLCGLTPSVFAERYYGSIVRTEPFMEYLSLKFGMVFDLLIGGISEEQVAEIVLIMYENLQHGTE